MDANDLEKPTFVGCATAAKRLRLTTEAVRLLIKRGTLPATRASEGYNARYMIPKEAVERLAAAREAARSSGGTASPSSDGADPKSETLPVGQLEQALDRIHALEDTLTALRASNEHTRRAFDLQQRALEELASANVLLEDAVTATVLPATARGAEV